MIYNSIHNCPIGIFQRIKNNIDISLLSANTFQPLNIIYKIKAINKIKNNILKSSWAKVNDEYIKEYKISKTYKEWVDYKTKELECYSLSNKGDRTKRTDAKIYELKAYELLNKHKGMSYKECKDIVQKKYNQYLNENTMTVKEFYDIIENLIKNG